jgi:hypothetical protein
MRSSGDDEKKEGRAVRNEYSSIERTQYLPSALEIFEFAEPLGLIVVPERRPGDNRDRKERSWVMAVTVRKPQEVSD